MEFHRFRDFGIAPKFGSDPSRNSEILEDAITVAYSQGKELWLAPGEIPVNRDLVIRNLPGLVIRGTRGIGWGAGTLLKWVGPPDGSFLTITNSPKVCLEGFAFQATNPKHRFCTLRNEPVQGHEIPSYSHRFTDLSVDGVNGHLAEGFVIERGAGDHEANDSEHLWDRCFVTNLGRGRAGQDDSFPTALPAGIRVDQEQAKQLTIRGCNFNVASRYHASIGYGVHVKRGTINWEGSSGGISACRTAIALEQPSSRQRIVGGDFELNGQLLRLGPVFTHGCPILVQDLRCGRRAPYSSGEPWIEVRCPGPVKLESLSFDGESAGAPMVHWKPWYSPNHPEIPPSLEIANCDAVVEVGEDGRPEPMNHTIHKELDDRYTDYQMRVRLRRSWRGPDGQTHHDVVRRVG